MYRLKGTAGAVVNRSYPLTGRLTVGTTAECDVLVEADGDAGLAIEINLAEDGGVAFNSPGGGIGVTLNGAPVSTGRLEPGDELRIGRCAFLLQAPGRRPERVLEADALGPRRFPWIWLAAAAVIVLGLLAWVSGWLG